MLQEKYRKDSPIIASFSFSDLLSNNSYMQLYCSEAFSKATIYESYETGATTSADGKAGIAQTFTVGNTGTNEDFFINGFEVKMRFYSDADHADLYAEIQECTAGVPNGSVIARTRQFEGFYGTSDFNWTKVNFSEGAKLKASTQYALVLKLTGADASDSLYLKQDDAGTYTGGKKYDYGVGWVEDVGADLVFRILGDTRPFLSFFPVDFAISEPVVREFTVTSTYASIATTTISTIINVTGILQGDAFIKIPTVVSDVASVFENFYWELELFKIHNSVETSIGTANTNAHNSIANETVNFLSKINLNHVTINQNDELRLNLNLKIMGASATGIAITMNWKDVELYLPFKTQ